MSSIETIFLDTVDGFGFESVCERIFTKLNWGKVERIGSVADGGRDIVIHQEGGSIVVECKHQPNTSIGRPIIQKLHSAVISSGAVKGIVITTGKFSREAIEHAQFLSRNTPIELFDLRRLSELAQEANMKLVLNGQNTMIFSFPSLDVPTIKKNLATDLDKIQSYPKAASELMILIPKHLHLEPKYVIRASVHQIFSTSAGIIHQVNEPNIFYVFNKNGIAESSQQTDFLKNASISEFNTPEIACPITRGNFELATTTLSDHVKSQISRKYSVNVKYYGRNNVGYRKFCKIGPRSIIIHDTKSVLLPSYSLKLGCLKQNYEIEVMFNDKIYLFKKYNLDKCSICNKQLWDNKLLCNDCGSLAHKPKFFGSHSFVCKNCKKTICKNCAFWWRKMLFFKKILCENCANMKPEKKRKLVKEGSK